MVLTQVKAAGLVQVFDLFVFGLFVFDLFVFDQLACGIIDAPPAPSYPRGGAEHQQLIFIKLT